MRLGMKKENSDVGKGVRIMKNMRDDENGKGRLS